MTDQIKNGFRKCGLYPLNPNKVDYSKCVRNTLERTLLNRELEQNEQDGTSDVNGAHLEIAKAIIQNIEPKLESYGINVRVIYNEIDELRPRQIQEIQVGTVLPMDKLEIVPFQNVILEDAGDQQEAMELDDPIEEKNDDETDENVMERGTVIRQHYYAEEKKVKHSLNSESEPIIEDNKKNDDILPQGQHYHAEEKKVKHSFNSESEPIIGENEKNDDILRQGQLNEDNEDINIMNEEKKKEDFEKEAGTKEEKHENTPQEDPAVLSVAIADESKHSNKDEPPQVFKMKTQQVQTREPILDPFAAHLLFPNAVEKSGPKKIKVKLPSAISSQAWRDHYLKKDQEKQDKIDKMKLKKQQRQENLRKKQNIVLKKKRVNPQRKKRTRPSSENVKPHDLLTVDRENKIQCTLCDEDLISDTEEDLEKNIGCDYCTSWFHLKCTEFCDLSYEVASTKDYKCDLCK